MVAKKANQKNGRQKKVLRMVNEIHVKDNTNMDVQQIRHHEDVLRRQLIIIKKDYNKLMSDVVDSYGMIKNWVELQAASKSESIKTRFIKN